MISYDHWVCDAAEMAWNGREGGRAGGKHGVTDWHQWVLGVFEAVVGVWLLLKCVYFILLC